MFQDLFQDGVVVVIEAKSGYVNFISEFLKLKRKIIPCKINLYSNINELSEEQKQTGYGLILDRDRKFDEDEEGNKCKVDLTRCKFVKGFISMDYHFSSHIDFILTLTNSYLIQFKSEVIDVLGLVEEYKEYCTSKNKAVVGFPTTKRQKLIDLRELEDLDNIFN